MWRRVPSSPITQALQREEPSGNFSNRSYLWFIGVLFRRLSRFTSILVFFRPSVQFNCSMLAIKSKPCGEPLVYLPLASTPRLAHLHICLTIGTPCRLPLNSA